MKLALLLGFLGKNGVFGVWGDLSVDGLFGFIARWVAVKISRCRCQCDSVCG